MVPGPPSGEDLATRGRTPEELDVRAAALRALVEDGPPFLVAGAYAFFEYTGIYRDTKDLDLFLRRRHVPRALRALERAGFRAEMTDPDWIAKGFSGEYFVDLIFSSGNGVAVVDDAWFAHAREAVVMGVSCRLAPPEEMIWSKAFVNERERYDGADVVHLVHACGQDLDWERLLERFDQHWEVLFSHLVLYRYVYPSERSRVPPWVLEELCGRTLGSQDWPEPVCRGNLISRVQYQHDYERRGYADGRRWHERQRRKARGHGGQGRQVPPGGDR